MPVAAAVSAKLVVVAAGHNDRLAGMVARSRLQVGVAMTAAVAAFVGVGLLFPKHPSHDEIAPGPYGNDPGWSGGDETGGSGTYQA
jgi:hypothetical protein